jgi:hypothetical protein
MKILKGEYLFSKEGLHILDSKGIAILAEEDTECEILPEHIERVRHIVIGSRLIRGLDEDGNEIKVEEPIQEQPEQEESETTPDQTE